MIRGLNGRLLAGSAILLVIIAAAFAVTLEAVDRLHAANANLQRSLTAIAAADRLERLAVDAETAQRGFVITGEERFLEPYRAAFRELPTAKEALLSTLPDDASNGRRALADGAVAKVTDYVGRFVSDQIALARRDPGGARDVVASGAGKLRVDAIRADFAALERAERANAAQVRGDSDAAADRALLFALLGLICCPLLIALFAGYLSRLVVRPIRRVAAAAHRLATGDLSVRVAEDGVAEAGTLARGFNTMASAAQHGRDELESQNAELEAQQGELERTFRALGDEKQRADLFHRVVASVSAAVELDELSEVLLRELGDVLDADAGTLYAMDVSDIGGALMLAGARGFDRAALPERLARGDGLAGRAVVERRSIAADHGESGLRVAAFGGDVALRHELHLPLTGSTHVAGVLSFGRLGDAPFSPAAIEQAARLAEPAAVGLVRALTTQYVQHHAEVNQAVLETAQDAFIATDGTARVLEWSPQAELLFGWSAEEAIGRRLSDLIVREADRAPFEAWREQLLAGGEDGAEIGTQRLEATACHKDAHELTVELSLVPLRIGAGWRLNAFVRDITGRVLREREREARAAVSRVLAEVEGRETLVGPTLGALGTAMRWPLVVFWIPDEHGQLTCADLWQAPAAEGLATLVHLIRTSAVAPGAGLPGRVWESGEASWTRATGDVSARASAAAEAGLRIAAGAPVGRGDHALGVLEFWQREGAPPDAELFDTLDAIAGIVVQVVERRAAEAEADRLKNEFFALVSHELRTPLTSIVGYVELLLDGEVGEISDQQERFLGIVERNSRRLQRLVGDLLFVAQVEAGTLSLEHGRARLDAIVQDAVDGVQPRAEQVGVSVTAQIEPVPEIGGDADRLGQLVDNLVSNALKFTPSGGSVTVRLLRDGGELVIAVSDTGIGIPAAEQARLFDRFFRASTAVEGEIPGIGLGLSICQAIVEGHGGRIAVESEVGRGTTFRVTLPVRAPLASTPETPAVAAGRNGASTR